MQKLHFKDIMWRGGHVCQQTMRIMISLEAAHPIYMHTRAEAESRRNLALNYLKVYTYL